MLEIVLLLPFIVLKNYNGGALTTKLSNTQSAFSKPFFLSTFYNHGNQVTAVSRNLEI